MKSAKFLNYKRFLKPRNMPWEHFYSTTHNVRTHVRNATEFPEWYKIYYKSYVRMPSVNLPSPSKLNKQTLKKSILMRKSQRNFRSDSIDIHDISTLLYFSLGISNRHEKNSDLLRRFYPSGGARYPLETYVIARNVHGLKRHIYHYYVKDHMLEDLYSYTSLEVRDSFTQDFIPSAAAIIVLTGVFARSTIKYRNRGYNLTLLEAGHCGQNIYLISSALQMKCCAVAGFYEESLNKLLDIDSREESAIYAFVIGT